MHKSTVISYFGSQQKLADALTAAGFPIGQRSISDWPDPIPLDRAVQVAHITADDPRGPLTVDLALYKRDSSGDARAAA